MLGQYKELKEKKTEILYPNKPNLADPPEEIGGMMGVWNETFATLKLDHALIGVFYAAPHEGDIFNRNRRIFFFIYTLILTGSGAAMANSFNPQGAPKTDILTFGTTFIISLYSMIFKTVIRFLLLNVIPKRAMGGIDFFGMRQRMGKSFLFSYTLMIVIWFIVGLASPGGKEVITAAFNSFLLNEFVLELIKTPAKYWLMDRKFGKKPIPLDIRFKMASNIWGSYEGQNPYFWLNEGSDLRGFSDGINNMAARPTASATDGFKMLGAMMGGSSKGGYSTIPENENLEEEGTYVPPEAPEESENRVTITINHGGIVSVESAPSGPSDNGSHPDDEEATDPFSSLDAQDQEEDYRPPSP